MEWFSLALSWAGNEDKSHEELEGVKVEYFS